MPAEVTDNFGLAWKANIDYSEIPKDVEAIQKMLSTLGVGIISTDAISEPIQKAKETVKQTVKEISDMEVRQHQETAKKVGEIDFQINQQRERYNENWSATMDEQMRQLQEYQDQLNKPLAQRQSLPIKETQKQTFGIDKETMAILNEAKLIYRDLDQQTQEYVNELIELEMQMQKLAVAQKALDESREKGNITTEDYAKNSAALAAQERVIAESIDLVNQRQKDYEAITRASVGSIEEKKLALKQLETEYASLSEQERKSSVGDNLRKNMAALNQEIKGLRTEALGDFQRKTSTAMQELRKLRNEMASNPNSPMFDTWRERAKELQESMEAVRNELKLATSDSAGVDALAAGIRGLVGGFTAVTGAVGLFAEGNEEAEKAVQKTMAALAVLNGVQEVARILEKESAVNVYLTSLMRKRDAAATAAQTVATTAQTGATTAATTATNALTAAMRANPALVLVSAITALIGAYLIFRRRTDDVKNSQELLAESTKEVSNTYAEQRAKILPYVEALKNSNLTENQRLDIYDKLKAINPQIVAGIDAKSLSYENLTKNVQKYLIELRRQMRLEANEKAIQGSVQAELGMEDKIQQQIQLVKGLEAEVEARKKVGTVIVAGGSSTGIQSGINDDKSGQLQDEREKLEELLIAYGKQKQITEELTEGAVAYATATAEKTVQAKRSVEQIDKEIAEVRKLQSQESTRADEWSKYQAQILKLEKEREAITGKQEKKTRSSNRAENEYNSLLEKRLSTLAKLKEMERDASQTGMIDTSNVIDNINQKYDEQVEALKKVNAEIEKFNEKNPKRNVDLFGQTEFNRLEAARQLELMNAQYKADAEAYIKSLDEKKLAFDVFQQAQESQNQDLIDGARKLYADQLGQYSSYIDMLQGETQKIMSSWVTGQMNVGDLMKLKEFSEQYVQTIAENKKRETEITLETFSEILKNTTSFDRQRLMLEKKHQREIDVLRKTYTGSDLDDRLKMLKAFHQQETDDLENNLARQTEMYKKMNEDVVRFTRDQLKDRLREMNNILQKDSSLTPVMREELKQYINQLKELIKQSSKAAQTGEKIAKGAEAIGAVSNAIGGLADSVREVNADLAAMLQSLAQVGNTAASALNAAAGFMSGNVAQGITGTIQAIGNIFNNIAQKRQSERLAQQAVLDFQTRIKIGELELNAILRQRERDQIKLNKLKIEGLLAEQKLLQQQASLQKKTFDDIFQQLQKEQFVDSMSTRRRNNWGAALLGGVIGSIGTSRTETVANYASLIGKSFDDIEKLYLQGRLTPKANELFEQLQKIKQEGVDIDALLDQNAESLRQIFTGTTSDQLLDSIVDGFKNGLRSAEDFADTFENLMKNAVLNALKYQVLEGPLKEFYAQFATDAQSDNVLTEAEIEELKRRFNSIISNAGQQFKDLQDITNIDFNSGSSPSANSLKGAIKGITEQQAELLAGQFGGLRLTAIDILKMTTEQLGVLNDIRSNTSYLPLSYETIMLMNSAIQDFKLNGIKVK